MPCRNDGAAEEDACNLRREKVELETRLNKRLDFVTNLLCGICKVLEKQNRDTSIFIVPGLTEWWADHKKKDEERKRREDLKKRLNAEKIRKQEGMERRKASILKKLSKEERQILGLNNA